MPAESFERSRAAGQRVDEIQPVDASPASLPDAVLVKTDHDGGPMIFSSDARRYDA